MPSRPYPWPSARLTADLMHELHKASIHMGLPITALVEMGVRQLLALRASGCEAMTSTLEARGRGGDDVAQREDACQDVPYDPCEQYDQREGPGQAGSPSIR